ncbi:MAG: acetylglutamate kinase [Paludibacteraceae bacterium]|nr:acetylglutamate kinase [Paludibacteraceae bacterium]
MNINVIKAGGAVVEDEVLLAALLDRFVQTSGAKVLVHGGGRTATALAAQLGIETRMAEGRRITDSDMLRVVTMVYGGLVSKTIAAALQARGINAVGLTGADMDIIRAAKRPVRNGIDYGYAGDVTRVNADRLLQLLREGITPVVAPLTHDGQGHLLNTNADTIASETAKALAQAGCEVTLTYCFEKAGVLADADDERSVVPLLTPALYERLRADGSVSGGMLPKLDNAFAALRAGVKRVVITNATADATGTVLQL